ncbi:MAG: hypothetical protein P4L72_15855 [Parvibaculum sp.]|uniref:hypothetical protein n=1 Tax=Parvibaculum sp. TaxID=2024848 RepID=UPI00283DB890|nr:hypothetical protein [Parvibaculum sp.]MDR3500689.1 hypothetical protein [Parvibaculum sp.]
MKLLLRRDQQAGGLLGKTVTFSLSVRAELTDDEKANIAKYKLGKTVLYTNAEGPDPKDLGLRHIGYALAYKMLNLSLSVDDLQNGKQIACQEITEMLAVEEQIKKAAETFKLVLESAARFGGDEVLEF